MKPMPARINGGFPAPGFTTDLKHSECAQSIYPVKVESTVNEACMLRKTHRKTWLTSALLACTLQLLAASASVAQETLTIMVEASASLNPRLTVEDTIAFGPRVHGLSRRTAIARAHDLLHRVGLEPSRFAGCYPHEISGGQRQRVNIARALCTLPKILVADEIVSGLDVSIQAQLLNLLARLRAELGFAMLFISHDLSVVRHLCSRVLVMYGGAIVEQGSVEAVFGNPQHPHTRALISSVPPDDPQAPWAALARRTN